MSSFVTDLRPPEPRRAWRKAVDRLSASRRTWIGQIDTGVSRHPALGFDPSTPAATPANILLGESRDLLSAALGGDPAAPGFSDLRVQASFLDRLTDYPDHGTKTLSIILADNDELRGVAPGAHVAPVRIADGPIFQDTLQRDLMGAAFRHFTGLASPPRVLSVSMGNPGALGPFALLQFGFGMKPGFDEATRRAIDAAYEMGVITVCAAGQVVNTVVFPARYRRTIAVGGLTPDDAHYPPAGYDLPEAVDVWALASGVNRAASFVEAGVERHVYARTAGDGVDNVSGTSYACPQVAAAAALWAETHHDDLPPLGAPDGWKAVEMFRAALAASSKKRRVKLSGASRRKTAVKVLDIEALLATKPSDVDDKAKRPEAADHVF